MHEYGIRQTERTGFSPSRFGPKVECRRIFAAMVMTWLRVTCVRGSPCWSAWITAVHGILCTRKTETFDLGRSQDYRKEKP